MSRAAILAAALGAAFPLAACDERPPPAAAPKASAGNETGYLASPAVTAARIEAGSTVLLGKAQPGAKVRLATPAGEALQAEADREGDWTLTLRPVPQPRIFGLSMTAGTRIVQAQGYVLVTPAGEAAVLRAGTGALRFDRQGAPRITAFDFDREGGAAVSGRAPAEEAVSVRLDGAPVAEGRADQAGRFNIALSQPVRNGRHEVEITGAAFTDQAGVEVTAAPPIEGAAFRLAETPLGVRADWMTPGGGVQSTLLLD